MVINLLHYLMLEEDQGSGGKRCFYYILEVAILDAYILEGHSDPRHRRVMLRGTCWHFV